jgi:hypothetical protein
MDWIKDDDPVYFNKVHAPLDQIANVDHGSARRSSRRRAEQVAEEICQLRRAQSPRSTALRVLREKQILPPGIEERAAAATYPVPMPRPS